MGFELMEEFRIDRDMMLEFQKQREAMLEKVITKK